MGFIRKSDDVQYINGVEVAKIEDYGFKRHDGLKKFWKVLSTIIVYIVIFLIYLSILLIALQSFNKSTSVEKWAGFSFKWYKELFTTNDDLTLSIRNTFLISVASTILSTIIGTLVAIGIYYSNGKFKQRIMLFNNIPLLNADIVTGISIMLIFSLVMKLPIPGFEYIFGFPTMLIAHMYFSIPYVVLNVLPKLKEIDPNMMDAALDLGLKPRKAIIRVLVPAIKSGILAGLIFAFTMSFDDFVISYYTTGNGFSNLSIWVYGSIGRKSLSPAVYAFSTLVTFGSMAVLLLINFLNTRKDRKQNKNKKEVNKYAK